MEKGIKCFIWISFTLFIVFTLQTSQRILWKMMTAMMKTTKIRMSVYLVSVFFSQKLYTFTHTHGSFNIDRHGEHIGDWIMNVLINILTVLTYFQLYITHKQFKTFLFHTVWLYWFFSPDMLIRKHCLFCL